MEGTSVIGVSFLFIELKTQITMNYKKLLFVGLVLISMQSNSQSEEIKTHKKTEIGGFCFIKTKNRFCYDNRAVFLYLCNFFIFYY